MWIVWKIWSYGITVRKENKTVVERSGELEMEAGRRGWGGVGF